MEITSVSFNWNTVCEWVTMTRRRYVAVCGATTRILHAVFGPEYREHNKYLKLNISSNYQCRLQLKMGAAGMLEKSEVENVKMNSSRRRHLPQWGSSDPIIMTSDAASKVNTLYRTKWQHLDNICIVPSQIRA